MKKGFTLVELLITVTVIAILAIVVILTINPSSLLQQSRDGSRISDMSNLNKAVSLYYEDAINNPSTLFMGTSSVVYVSIPDPTATSTAGDQCQGLSLPGLPTGLTYQCAATSTNTHINGVGWIPINFSNYSAGSVINKLPVDPTNTTSTGLYYTYETDGVGGFMVAAFLESQKNAALMSGDGGVDPIVYSKGSNITLPTARGLVEYWPLNEGTGSSTIDYSGDNATGTWSGTTAGTSGYYSAGKVGPWAGTFDGSTDGISLANATSFTNMTSSFTMSQWIKTTSGGTQMYTIGNAISGNGYRFGLSGGKIAFLIGNGSFTETTCGSQTVNDGTWHMITGVFSLSGTYKFSCYLDGSLQSTISLGSNYSGFTTIAPGIGKPPCCTAFNGSLDDVRIYDYALPASEIQEMYYAEH